MLETPALFCTKVFFNDLNSANLVKANVQDKILRMKKCFHLFLQLFEMASVDSLLSIPEKKYINIVTLILQPTLWCKVCVVKRFYFIRIEIIRSCQEWSSKAASIAVAARRTVRVAEIWKIIGWRVAGSQVMTSSKCRTIRVTAVCGAFVIAVPPCLIELYRRPSRPVYQREQKGLWIVLIANATRL